ncbi:MAG: molybdopterin converting factor subunit 1 [Opitutales bacterium]|jgi:molybdopterin synthase sulfur carrier subunit|nr:molybdopterin converting factor subunit 1 [Opitutales bacterium]|tara:strand:+ start:6061 stop:6309 length:249 start_codon:yes stop_codon:yes gene_type:complete
MSQINVTLRYFAMLRESAGVESEDLSTSSETPKELYAELQESKGFSLGATELRVAVNGEFAALDDALNEGDEIAFIPPVSGG